MNQITNTISAMKRITMISRKMPSFLKKPPFFLVFLLFFDAVTTDLLATVCCPARAWA
ncbi:hypothetical protein [Streptomyces xanthochromogenes]|uniref:hypothetical protein n=1 Tax=Streptomyces xanthochromogenes TaxID=67384 RepID=UPI002F3E74BE